MQKRWRRQGIIVWAHYLAVVDEAVEMVLRCPDDSKPEPESPGMK